jgi:hypothetical protein
MFREVANLAKCFVKILDDHIVRASKAPPPPWLPSLSKIGCRQSHHLKDAALV